MAELVDALHSKCSDENRAGSSPASGTHVARRDIVHSMSRHFLCLEALMCRLIVPLFLAMGQDVVPLWVRPRRPGKVSVVSRFPVFPAPFCCRCCSPLHLRFMATGTVSSCAAQSQRGLYRRTDCTMSYAKRCPDGRMNDVVKPNTASVTQTRCRDIVWAEVAFTRSLKIFTQILLSKNDFHRNDCL